MKTVKAAKAAGWEVYPHIVEKEFVPVTMISVVGDCGQFSAFSDRITVY